MVVRSENSCGVYHPLLPYRNQTSFLLCKIKNNKQQPTKNIMSKLRETFLDELADIYDAEKQLVKALPKMAKAAAHEDLKHALDLHLEQTEEHLERLEHVFEIFDQSPKGKKCKAM